MDIKERFSKVLLSKGTRRRSTTFKYLLVLLCVIAFILSSSDLNLIEDREIDYLQSTAFADLKVHFIDVGQADSILVQQGNHSMIIDAGNNDDETIVKQYIEELGITKFDYVIGSHVHEDHIGSLDGVINAYNIDKIIFSKQTSTTKTFENFIKAVKNKGLKLYSPKVGEVFALGDATFEVMAPNSSSYESANDYSIVIKLEYGDTSFLLTADAESISETEMLNKNLNLKSDVLKLGHHGSKTSTTQKFLDEVNPEYAVISVGRYNRYGQPNKSVMNRLKKAGITVYKTDTQGSIVAISDGENISFYRK